MFEITGKRHNNLCASLARLAAPSRRWVSLDFFTNKEITALKYLADAQTFRTARSEIVHRQNRVFQDFDVCFPAPRIGAFDDLAAGLESGLFAAGAIWRTIHLKPAFSLMILPFSVTRQVLAGLAFTVMANAINILL